MFQILNALLKPPRDPSIIIDVAVSMFAPQPSAFLYKSLRSLNVRTARPARGQSGLDGCSDHRQ